jgi:predicted secreted hydrolase
MDAAGQVVIDGEEFRVSGQAWMDREFGRMNLGPTFSGWDWFALQFDDGREMMVYRIRDRRNRTTAHSTAVLFESDGSVRRFVADELTVVPLDAWSSPRTGIEYSSGWRIEAPAVDAELVVQPLVKSCELDTRGSTNMIYWEGPASVQGRVGSTPVLGDGFVELVDGQRPEKLVGEHDFSTHNIGVKAFLVNEWRLRRFGPGCTVTGNA